MAGRTALKAMQPFVEEIVWVIIGFTLNVLRQAKRDGTGFCRIGQYAHGINAGAHQLFRAHNAIPIFTDGAKCVVGADA
ncbi:hypothetical protein D3C81_2182280 [compost metagenome]